MIDQIVEHHCLHFLFIIKLDTWIYCSDKNICIYL